MNIWELWNTQSTDYTYGFLKDDQVPDSLTLGDLKRDNTYLIVTLRRMKIENVRTGWKKFHASVNSEVGAMHATGTPSVFRQVISPPKMRDVDPKTIDRVIVENQRLFGPSPYRGDHIKLNAALMAVEVADLSGPFLDVLTNLAGAAGVSYMTVAKPFLEPLGKGIDLLVGTSGSQGLEIYLVTNLTEPRTGVYIVMRASATEVPLASLKLNPDFTLTSNVKQDLKKYPYMVMTLEAKPDRADWRGIPEIGKAYEVFRDALKQDKPNDINSAFEHFRRVVLLSDDLHQDHAKELVSQTKALWNAVDQKTFTSGPKAGIKVPGLEMLNPFDKNWKFSPDQVTP